MNLQKYKENLIKKKKQILKNRVNNINKNFRKKRSYNTKKNIILNNQRQKKIKHWRKKINQEIAIIKAITRMPQKNALLIGINYKNTNYELFGCINDCIDIREKLLEKGYNVNMVHDDSEIKPKKSNIIDEVRRLLENSSYRDSLFIYYSGHGSYIKDYSNDEVDKKDEVIVTLDNKYIVDDEFNNLLHKYMKKYVSLNIVMDCCHSGSQFDLRFNYNPKLRVNRRCKHIDGNVILISGCRDKEVSYESYINNKNSGALTSTLLKYFNSGLLYRHLMNKLIKELKYNGFNQRPQLSSGFKFNTNKRRFIV